MTEKAETNENEGGGTKGVQRCVMEACPFCKAVPVPHRKDEYKIYHDVECFLAAVYENSGWLYGEKQIKLWNKRAS